MVPTVTRDMNEESFWWTHWEHHRIIQVYGLFVELTQQVTWKRSFDEIRRGKNLPDFMLFKAFAYNRDRTGNDQRNEKKADSAQQERSESELLLVMPLYAKWSNNIPNKTAKT